MPNLLSIASDLAWPFAIGLAWLAGEYGHRQTGLPRICFYSMVGFGLAQTQAGLLPPAGAGSMLVMANVAFGLILFELGYRINLRWLSSNPWIALAGLVSSSATFGVVYALATGFGAGAVSALLLAALAMSTSPATVLCVINEVRSAGQVTERVTHLAALNCVLAVFAFNVIVSLRMVDGPAGLLETAARSFGMLLASAAASALAGVVAPALLRGLANTARDATVAFALAVILLVALTHGSGLSPLLATLSFGLVARHRRVAFSQAQRNFGALGELLTVLLFVFAAATLEWTRVLAGAGLALALIGGRSAAQVIGVTVFSRASGVSWRKGALTGVALAPMSVFVVLMIEHARRAGVRFGDELSALAAMTLILELAGPVLLQRALLWARESGHDEENRDAA